MLRNRPIVLVLFLATLVPCTLFAQSTDAIIYDEYRWGVHIAELSVSHTGDSAEYVLRRRDVYTDTWQDPVTAAAAELALNETFRLGGAIAQFPAQLAELANIDWSTARAIGWPDESSIYVRHRQITEQVNGHPVTASYWGLRDASVPMDLVVGVDNIIIAAIDVQRDWVVVRRGFERFTTVGGWKDSSMSQPLHAIRELKMVMMPTTAGPSLATRVYLPDGNIEGPFPAIFVRTPYGITNLIDKYWQYVVRGYAVVLQAARGTAYWDPESRSQGVWDSMIQEPPDGADGRQRLAAKAQGFDTQQIVRWQLGCGVAFDGQRQFVRGHALAVVGNGNERLTAVPDHHVDTPRPGVDGVFHQFLDHRGRALDHLAGGDAVDDGFRQAADGHDCFPSCALRARAISPRVEES